MNYTAPKTFLCEVGEWKIFSNMKKNWLKKVDTLVWTIFRKVSWLEETFNRHCTCIFVNCNKDGSISWLTHGLIRKTMRCCRCFLDDRQTATQSGPKSFLSARHEIFFCFSYMETKKCQPSDLFSFRVTLWLHCCQLVSQTAPFWIFVLVAGSIKKRWYS